MGKKRILFSSNFSLANTGFGKYQKNLLSRLYKTGKYELAEIAAGVSDLDPSIQKLPWKVYGVCPKTNEEAFRWNSADPNTQRAFAYGLFRFEEAVLDFKPDIVINHEDLWQCSGWLKQTKVYGKFIPIAFHPLDAEPLTEEFAVFLKDFKHIYTYGKWSQKIGFDAGLPQTKIARLGVDSNVFKPLEQSYVQSLRSKYGIKPTDFVVLMVARNQIRKKYDALFESLNHLKQFNPELYNNIKILPFCQFSDPAGFDFTKLWRSRKIDTSKILTPYVCSTQQGKLPGCGNYLIYNKYEGENKNCPYCGNKDTLCTPSVLSGFTDEQLNEVYNIADLFVLATSNEGFGLPTCFLPNTLITNNLSHAIPIKEIKIGDKLLDSNGKENCVLSVMSKRVSEEILDIKAIGIPKISCTKEHPFYVYKNGEYQFIEAKELKVGDELLCPIPNKIINDIDYLDLESFGVISSKFSNNGIKNKWSWKKLGLILGYGAETVRRCVQNKIYIDGYKNPFATKETQNTIINKIEKLKINILSQQKKISKRIELTDDTLFAFGLYIAEGWCSKNGDIGFSFHKKETHLHKRAENLIKQFGVGCSKRLTSKNGISIGSRITNSYNLFSLFGTRAWRKKIPDFLYNLPDSKLIHLLRGIFYGDGCLNFQSFTTTSPFLAFQFRNCLLRMGYRTSLNVLPPRAINYHNTYTISFSNLHEFEDFLNLKKTKHYRKQTHTIIKNNFLYTKIKNITKRKYSGNVYNIDTNGNSTYIANCVSVHNCEAMAAQKPCLVTNYSTCKELVDESQSGHTISCNFSTEYGTLFYKANITPESVAKSIGKMYKLKPQKRQEMGENGRKYALTELNYDKLAKDWEDVFDNIKPIENVNWDVTPKQKNPNPNGQLPPVNNELEFLLGLYKHVLDTDIVEETGGNPLDNQGIQYWLSVLNKKERTLKEIEDFFRKTALDDLGKKPVDILSLLDQADIKRMLFVMPQSAGDNFLSTAIVSSLKEKYPEHSIYISCLPQFRDIWKNNPSIKGWIPYNEVMMQYSWGTDRFDKGIFDIVLTPTMLTQLQLPNWGHNGKTKSYLI
jgi:intein/homing endonuclease